MISFFGILLIFTINYNFTIQFDENRISDSRLRWNRKVGNFKNDQLLGLEWIPLTIGEIQASGWLKSQLEIQAAGLTYALSEFWPYVNQSIWVGGSTQDPGGLNERVPYWLNGAVTLAYLTQNQTLISKVEGYLDYILQHQKADGWFAPDCCDIWPSIPLLMALATYAEANSAKTQIIIPALVKFLQRVKLQLDKQPFDVWAYYRWEDLIWTIQWLCDNFPIQVNSTWMIEFARQIDKAGYDWKAFYDSNQFPTNNVSSQWTYQTHGVNNAQALKSSALRYRYTGNYSDWQSTDKRISLLDQWHGQPSGMFSCSETLAGLHPSQGTEFCSVVEAMFSYESIFTVFGSVSYADKVERLAFNALPAAMDAPMWSRVYLHSPNQINAAHDDPNIWLNDGDEASMYGLERNYGCCTANFPQGWPKYVKHMFMKSSSNINCLAAVLFGPSVLDTTLQSGNRINIEARTIYPFEDKIEWHISCSKTFVFFVRIPSWVHEGNLTLNTQKPIPVNGWGGDMFNITIPTGKSVLLFQMINRFRVVSQISDSISLLRGPLTFSLQMDEDWTKVAHYQFNSSDWQITPNSAWNYGLLIENLSNPDSSLKFVSRGSVGPIPFALWDLPVYALVQGRQISEWKSVKNAADYPPQSPVHSKEPLNQLKLVPFGSAKLRISSFPS